MYIFFFQAEDGIRDTSVTGVQTCALPIFVKAALASALGHESLTVRVGGQVGAVDGDVRAHVRIGDLQTREDASDAAIEQEIGRASCRERVEIWGAGG